MYTKQFSTPRNAETILAYCQAAQGWLGSIFPLKTVSEYFSYAPQSSNKTTTQAAVVDTDASGRDQMDSDVCIASVVRTPIGCFQGSLAKVPATKLGAIAIREAVSRAGVAADKVGEVFMGNVLSANLGQNPAKQAALGGGLPSSVPCTTVNKVCASGLKAVLLGAQSIMAGTNDVVIAGGMENMSSVPYYIPKARFGMKIGHSELIDGLIHDGLWDPYDNVHMGNCGELCAKEYGISREAQDDHALESFRRANKFRKHSKWERVAVELGNNDGHKATVVNADEGIDKLNEGKLRKLKPVFKKDGGTVTAGNASQISDGAAAIVLARRSTALQLNLPILGRILGMSDAAQEPKRFTTTPSVAYTKALENAGLAPSQIDYVEINEAFSVVFLVNQQLLNLDPECVNVHGGAVALGHPLGCSGARILATLMNVLRVQDGRYGVATICNGGGGASAVVVESAMVGRQNE